MHQSNLISKTSATNLRIILTHIKVYECKSLPSQSNLKIVCIIDDNRAVWVFYIIQAIKIRQLVICPAQQ